MAMWNVDSHPGKEKQSSAQGKPCFLKALVLICFTLCKVMQACFMMPQGSHRDKCMETVAAVAHLWGE